MSNNVHNVKEWLIAEVAQAEERLADAQADLDAARRMLARYEANQPTPSPASVDEIRLAAIAILRNHGEAIHRQVIHQELSEQGLHISGKDPVANLGAILSRFGEDFHPHGNGIWGLKEWERKPVAAQPLVDVPAVNGNGEIHFPSQHQHPA